MPPTQPADPPQTLPRGSAPERGRRPHLLLIAFYFPPTRASGVYRGRAMANHFAAAGWDVTVLTVEREFFRDYIHSYDPSLEATVSPDVVVERVPFSGWQWEPDVRRIGLVRALFPRIAARVRRRAESLIFPDAYSSWIRPVVRRGEQVHRQRPVDLVLTTGNPWSSFAAAWKLQRSIGVPYVLDYRDAWTMNQYTHARPPKDLARAQAWEGRVLDGCALAVFVNEAQREWHAEQYPAVAARTRVVENGWEPELLGDLPVRLPAPDRPLRLSYLGTMTGYMPLREFFDGWRLARTGPELTGSQVVLHGHLGFFSSARGAVRSALPLTEGIDVVYAGPVPKAEVRGAYSEADVLLLILPGSRFVTGGKVYEYMATGKPIVSVHDPDSSANGPLSRYPLWFPVRDLSPEAIRDALLAAARAARGLTEADVAAARAQAARFTRDAQLEPLEEQARELVRAPSSGSSLDRGPVVHA